MLVATLVAVPVALLAGLIAFVLLGGGSDDRGSGNRSGGDATGPVTVVAPPSLAGADETCGRLLGALPHTLDGRTPRAVTDAPQRIVAWGDPAIVLRCGVARPKALTADAQLLGIEGVEWVAADDHGTTVWTTTSLAYYVEVRVPAAYRDKASQTIINPLAAPLKATVPPAR